MRRGNGKWESTQFNSRLQPTQIALGTVQNGTDKLKLNYSYGDWNGSAIDATKNNGNIVQQVITVPTVGVSTGFTATQKYYYDSLNRIDDATEEISGQTPPSWRQDFTYDRYGNRNFQEANITTLPKNCGTSPNFTVCTADVPIVNPSPIAATNKLTGYTYDPSGNTTQDAELRKFIYDGENKQVKVETVNSGGTVTGTVGEYIYDGDGKRIKKKGYTNNVLTEETIFVYDATGKLVAEYSSDIASVNDAKVAYLTNDHLGSPRINTDQNGLVTARHDYHPFGDEISTSHRIGSLGYTSDTVRKQFTGYELDKETGLDFAQARYFNSGFGRFSSPDSFTNDTFVSNPQSWNLYAYVRNNPMKLVDATGNKATIYYSYNSETDTISIKIKATFAVYGAKGQNVSKEDLEGYSRKIKEGIEDKIKGSFKVNGRNFELTSEIGVTVADSEEAAISSKADNIAELGYIALTDNASAMDFRGESENFDRMVGTISSGNFNGLSGDSFGQTAAHEFGAHLLAALHSSDPNSLFYESSGNSFLQSDFERMFSEVRPMYTPPIPYDSGTPKSMQRTDLRTRGFSRILTATNGGIENRRANRVYSTLPNVWVQGVKK